MQQARVIPLFSAPAEKDLFLRKRQDREGNILLGIEIFFVKPQQATGNQAMRVAATTTSANHPLFHEQAWSEQQLVIHGSLYIVRKHHTLKIPGVDFCLLQPWQTSAGNARVVPFIVQIKE